MLQRAIRIFTHRWITTLMNCKKVTVLNPCQSKTSFSFSKSKPLTVDQVPKGSIQVKASSIVLGEQQIDYFRTEGSISIVQKVSGASSESGELYALKQRCSACKAQSIRSFTRNSYHKGVVMVKCGSCQAIQLVADNLGWFQPLPNEQIPTTQTQKMHDPVAIVRFLRHVLGKDKDLGKSELQLQEKRQKSE